MPLPTVNSGDLITSASWNNLVDQSNQNEANKLDKSGGGVTGDLTVSGKLGVKTTNPQEALQIGDRWTFHDGGVKFIGYNLRWNGSNLVKMVNGFSSEVRFHNNGDLAFNVVSTGNAGTTATLRPGLHIQNNGNVGVGTDDPKTKLHVSGGMQANALTLSGRLETTAVKLNSSSGVNSVQLMKSNNDTLNLEFGRSPYLFRIGHTSTITGPTGPTGSLGGPGRPTRFFSTKFSVNQAGNVAISGDLTVGGSKGGYVADFFINRVGDNLEEGDVVIINESGVKNYYGINNNIPILEVDLTSKAYDTRACGIVVSAISEDELPPVEDRLATAAEIEFIRKNPDTPADTKFENIRFAYETHPLKPFAKSMDSDSAIQTIPSNQMGKMVTLGAFAHCKVDADIASIKAGDLLTTSTTKGHAQKVDGRKRADGAIIGKALASLEKGKGKIPVMVFFG